jgi:hypothetical protein
MKSRKPKSIVDSMADAGVAAIDARLWVPESKASGSLQIE